MMFSTDQGSNADLNLPAVYLMCSDGTNRYKIGYTNDTDERLQSLQGGNPNELRLVYTRHHLAAEAIEAEVKSFLEPVRVHREWYEAPADVLISTIDQFCDRYFEGLSGPTDRAGSVRSLRIPQYDYARLLIVSHWLGQNRSETMRQILRMFLDDFWPDD